MPTIKDVAKRAKVAPSTVSYVLSGKRPISSEVRERVNDAIEKLSFKPNRAATQLRTGSSGSVGMAHPLSPNTYSQLDFIVTASDVLQDKYALSLFTKPTKPKVLLEALEQNHVDGFMLMQITRMDSRVEALRKTPHPFVLIGRCENTTGLSYVDFDFQNSIYLGIEHLASLGHETIGYIDLPEQNQREKLGFLFHLEHGLQKAVKDFDVRVVHQEAGFKFEDGYKATKKLFKRNKDITAILAFIGNAHVGVLRALQHLGKRVPEDCSLVCSSTGLLPDWLTPRLTSVDTPLGELGKVGAQLMLERLAGLPPRQVLLPAMLVERESTAPVK
jgi:DNA-binding LacI/PurR family transcriptional regulator